MRARGAIRPSGRIPKAGAQAYLRSVTSRPAPRDLRASDADRDAVLDLLGAAAADGRLTLAEHGERAGRAHAARTLGELAELTADLALPSAQPIRLDGRRAVAGVLSRERRAGRWVVPASFPVAAVLGEVTLDLRDALLQSPRTVVYATVIAGHLELIVPEGVAVVVSGRSVLGRQIVRGVRGGPGGRGRRGAPGAGAGIPGTGTPGTGTRGAGAPGGTQPVIEVRGVIIGGTIRATTPRRSRWRAPSWRGRAAG